MKIAVIGFNNIIKMPYMRYYKRLFEAHGVEADYYCWNRKDDDGIVQDGNIIEFNTSCGAPRFVKIFAMLKWRRNMMVALKRGRYDKIIILTTIPAVLLKKYLLKHYKGQYLLDIRDFTYDNIDLYRKIVKKLCDNSAKTFISSPGFRKFLLSDNLMQIHNIDVQRADYGAPDMRKKTLTLGYIGQITYYSSCMRLMNDLKNSRYRLYFAGIFKEDSLQRYSIARGIRNVIFEGEFDPADKRRIYKNIDIVNCYYGINGEHYKEYALPNRLYDALYCNRPILALKNTALAEIIEKYKIGVTVEEKDNIEHALDDYIESFDKNEFEKNIARCIADIEKSQHEADAAILAFAGTV